MFNFKKYLVLSSALLMSLLTGCSKPENPVNSTTTSSTPDYTDVELGPHFTNQLRLEATYQNKDFLVDNIGKVQLSTCVDGDTAHFRSGNQIIKIRFLGVDTPESTISIEPWGKAASVQMCKWLTDAKEIVLEGNDLTKSAQLDTTGSRYLAYVWGLFEGDTEFKNLNLWTIEEAYSRVKISGAKYDDLFYQADARTSTTKKRIWGENDPNYDYAKTYQEVTSSELNENKESYVDKKVKVSGYVTRKIVANFFIGDNEGAGIYVFVGFSSTGTIKVGNYVSVEGVWTKNDNYGYQLAGTNRFQLEDSVLNDNTKEFEPSEEFTIDDIANGNVTGILVKLKGVTVVSKPNFDETAFPLTGYSITVKDQSDNQLTLRVDAGFNVYSNPLGNILPSDFGDVGDQIDVIGVPSYYFGSYQLMICIKSDVIKN